MVQSVSPPVRTYDRNWWIAVALTVLIGGGGSIVFSGLRGEAAPPASAPARRLSTARWPTFGLERQRPFASPARKGPTT